MASTILANVAEKAKEMTAPTDKKQADMATVTRHVHGDRWRITSDFGVKQTNTDAWLHVGTEDKQGPRLLEDHFGREKIHRFDHERILDLPGMQFSTTADVVESYGVVTASEVKPQSFQEAVKMVKGATDFLSAYQVAISQHKNFDREMDGLNAMVAY